MGDSARGSDSVTARADPERDGRYDDSYRPRFVEVGEDMARRYLSEDEQPLAAPRFVHLHVHSAYSLLEGALKVERIVDHAAKDHQPAIAVTDTNNLFASLEFAQKARKGGVQPIIGVQIEVDFGDRRPRGEQRHDAPHPSLVLLATSEVGYRNLAALVSRAYLEGDRAQRVHLPLAWLEGATDDIVCLTGGPEVGPVDRLLREGKPAAAVERLAGLADLFGDRLYVELQRQGDWDRRHEGAVLRLAYAANLPIVATNEPFFECPDDHEAHDALLAIAEGTLVSVERRRRLTNDHCLKGQAEMAALFADLPEALDNTIEIARRCTHFLDEVPPMLPRFEGGEGDEAERLEAEALRTQAFAGLKERFATRGLVDGFDEAAYVERLEFELSVIIDMGFPGYFLIVADFIRWAKSQAIPVGPGRGSGAGSLVAYALTITDVDPLRFSLLFERFLNPDRVSMPDFDIDFCQERREEVIDYVRDRYGRDQVGQIITFGSLQPRAAIRDIGRVMELSYGQTDHIAKMVPNNPSNPVTLQQALDSEPRLQETVRSDPVVGKVIGHALKLEGLYRHASTHAAGVVIGDRALQQIVPVYRDPRSDMPVTQLNMKWVEKAGLVKFDFLGLKTLTILETARKFLERNGTPVDIDRLPFDDPKSYELLSRGDTVGVFQVESPGMRKALLGMKPDCLEDVIALVALYRPGPMDNIPTYNERKHGREEIGSIHPSIDHILAETQGIIVYQEQVMQIAQELSGYTLAQADLLRRAMGKKIKAEMDAQKVPFIEGAAARGVSKGKANEIFELLAKFANYGFNKSHAAAYGLISYQTAYLKAHHPVEFLAACMSLDLGNTDKLNDFRLDAQRAGIEIVPPCVQRSSCRFEPSDGAILYALAALKGVGEHACEHICAMRPAGGFASLEDFFRRVDPRIVSKRVLEALVCAGAFDAFGRTREDLIGGLDRLMGLAQRESEARASGQVDMFGAAIAGGEEERVHLTAAEPWTVADRLAREFKVMGFYLSAHPLDEHADTLRRMRVQSFKDFQAGVKRGATAGRLAATVTGRMERRTRSGGKMAIYQLSDATGQFEARMFSEGLARYRDVLADGTSVIVQVVASERDDETSLTIVEARALEAEAGAHTSVLRVYLRDSAPLRLIARHLNAGGDGSVSFVIIKDEGEVEIELPERYQLSAGLASAVKAADGVVAVELV